MPQPVPVELMNQLIARAAIDNSLRQRLKQDPLRTLRAEGISVPAGMDVRVLEHSAAVYYLPLPENSSMLSEAALDGLAAAGNAQSSGVPQDISVDALKTAWSRLF